MLEKEWYRNFAAHIRGPREFIEGIDRMIATVQNELNVSRVEAIAQIFLWGLHAAVGEVKDEEVRREMRATGIKLKLMRAIRDERRDDQELKAALREMGLDRVVEVAEKAGLTEEDVNEVVASLKADMSWYDKTSIWLDTLLSDGEERSVQSVQRAAMAAGILPIDPATEDFEDQWGNMRTVASRMGVSRGGKRGYWQKVIN